MKLICKTRLLPPASFVGTTCTFVTTEDAPCAGIYSAILAEGRETVTIDWGDGSVERVAAVSKLVHAYAAPGTYTARISDDLASLTMSGSRSTIDFVKQCSGRLRALESNATRLTALGSTCFAHCPNLVTFDISRTLIRDLPSWLCKNCTSLAGRLDFPNVDAISASREQEPFAGCTGGLAEIRFAEANRAAIEATGAYRGDRTLGSGTAVCTFAGSDA